jgi:hypothetical protein
VPADHLLRARSTSSSISRHASALDCVLQFDGSSFDRSGTADVNGRGRRRYHSSLCVLWPAPRSTPRRTLCLRPLAGRKGLRPAGDAPFRFARLPRQLRNGAARPDQQHEMDDAHSEHCRIDSRDPRMRPTSRANWLRSAFVRNLRHDWIFVDLFGQAWPDSVCHERGLAAFGLLRSPPARIRVLAPNRAAASAELVRISAPAGRGGSSLAAHSQRIYRNAFKR